MYNLLQFFEKIEAYIKTKVVIRRELKVKSYLGRPRDDLESAYLPLGELIMPVNLAVSQFSKVFSTTDWVRKSVFSIQKQGKKFNMNSIYQLGQLFPFTGFKYF